MSDARKLFKTFWGDIDLAGAQCVDDDIEEFLNEPGYFRDAVNSIISILQTQEKDSTYYCVALFYSEEPDEVWQRTQEAAHDAAGFMRKGMNLESAMNITGPEYGIPKHAIRDRMVLLGLLTPDGALK